MQKQERQYHFNRVMESLGISFEDSMALRRIKMTLHRWSEKECGDENGGAIERDEVTNVPYWTYENGTGKRGRYRISDRETGALKRLAVIMAKYPHLTWYNQTDPRGCALYVIPKEKLGNKDVSAYYSSCGVAVCY